MEKEWSKDREEARNVYQRPRRIKHPPDQTNEEEIGSLSEKEFRVLIVKMIQNIGNRMKKIQETFNKDLEELKNSDEQDNN